MLYIYIGNARVDRLRAASVGSSESQSSGRMLALRRSSAGVFRLNVKSDSAELVWGGRNTKVGVWAIRTLELL